MGMSYSSTIKFCANGTGSSASWSGNYFGEGDSAEIVRIASGQEQISVRIIADGAIRVEMRDASTLEKYDVMYASGSCEQERPSWAAWTGSCGLNVLGRRAGPSARAPRPTTRATRHASP